MDKMSECIPTILTHDNKTGNKADFNNSGIALVDITVSSGRGVNEEKLTDVQYQTFAFNYERKDDGSNHFGTNVTGDGRIIEKN